MKYALLLLVFFVDPAWRLLTRVHARNAAVAAGTAAYGRGQANRAAVAFGAAIAAHARRVPDPRLVLDLAHAQLLAGRAAPAQASYGRLLASSPPALGSVARQQLAVLAARRGKVAQALGLLRQALLLDPHNGGARYNYEVLSAYLARQPEGPRVPPPPPPAPAPRPPAPDKSGPENSRSAGKAGTERPGEVNTPQPGSPAASLESRPNSAGQPDARSPGAPAGNAAAGSRGPGAGPPQPLASGEAGGTQRGLDRRTDAPAPGAPGRSTRPGADAATPADLRLQTQRERLEAMSLSPAQARQLLETLRAQEQQYLQQVARPPTRQPDPTKPTW